MRYEDNDVFDASDIEWSNVSLDNATHINYITVTSRTDTVSRLVGVPFCPDMLRYEDIGVADNIRGRVVRGFFWLMRWWR